jgi:hypothetical protein
VNEHTVTISGMQRRRFKTVSEVAVLIPCKRGEHDGWIANSQSLKVVKATDLDPTSRKFRSLIAGISRDEWSVLRGVKSMLKARELDDYTAAREAAKLLGSTFRIDPGDTNPAELRDMTENTFAVDALSSGTYLSQYVTRLLSEVRLVYWQLGDPPVSQTVITSPKLQLHPPRTEVLPGIYCESFKNAVAYKMLFGNLAICLRCHSPFLAKRPNENYDTIRCREAHRLARWRERKKIEAAGEEKGRKR